MPGTVGPVQGMVASTPARPSSENRPTQAKGMTTDYRQATNPARPTAPRRPLASAGGRNHGENGRTCTRKPCLDGPMVTPPCLHSFQVSSLIPASLLFPPPHPSPKNFKLGLHLSDPGHRLSNYTGGDEHSACSPTSPPPKTALSFKFEARNHPRCSQVPSLIPHPWLSPLGPP